MSFLDVSHVSLTGPNGPVLQDVSFSMRQRERIAIAGETGSGKTSLLKIIAGLSQADSGEVRLGGRRVPGSSEKLVPGHPDIAFLSQHFELPRFLRVEQVLEYANSMPGSEAVDLYAICQIDHLLARKTDQLSGGERQRIALARLLSAQPSLLLMDEPYSNLDVIHKQTLKQVTESLSAELGIALILVSHDPADTLSWADQIIVLRNGAVVQQGEPREIYERPVDAYAAGLFGRYNMLPAQLRLTPDSLSEVSIVRPERIRVGRAGVGVPNGRVVSTRYFGAFLELTVQFGNITLIVDSPDLSFRAGEEVVVAL